MLWSVVRNLLKSERLTRPFLYFWEFREGCGIRDGYGIRRIVRFWNFIELENHFQSVLNLGFRRASVTADAFFYLERSEFREGDSAFRDFRDYRSAGLRYGDTGFDVGREKEGFYAANFRLVGVAEFADVAADFH